MHQNSFDMKSQLEFARLSGDFNPIHINQIYSRRSLFGQTLVHGLHLVLWGIDQFCAKKRQAFYLKKIRVHFLFPVGLGADLTLDISEERPGEALLTISSGGSKSVKISFAYENKQDNLCVGGNVCWDCEPNNPSWEELEVFKGSIPLKLDRWLAKKKFPHFFHWGSLLQMSALCASTRIVGMFCPGLDSIYSAFSIQFDGPQSNLEDKEKSLIYFKTEKLKKNLKQLEISVQGPGFEGSIKAYKRPGAVEQPALKDLQAILPENSLVGKNIVIIGGTRGVGEVLAKLLGMAGANIFCSYHMGESEARKLDQEFSEENLKIQFFKFDCRNSDHVKNLKNRVKSNQPHMLFFCATPFIEATKASVFSKKLYKKFCSYYIKAFYGLFKELNNPDLELVWTPSTVYADPIPANLLEYGKSKQVLEKTVSILSQRHSNISWECPRLPRMATDQTLTLLGGGLPMPHEYFLEYFKEFKIAL